MARRLTRVARARQRRRATRPAPTRRSRPSLRTPSSPSTSLTASSPARSLSTLSACPRAISIRTTRRSRATTAHQARASKRLPEEGAGHAASARPRPTFLPVKRDYHTRIHGVHACGAWRERIGPSKREQQVWACDGASRMHVHPHEWMREKEYTIPDRVGPAPLASAVWTSPRRACPEHLPRRDVLARLLLLHQCPRCPR